MSEYCYHYIEANIACAVIFGIMLFHDLTRVDRQERQIKFDHTLASFIAYFISDSFWAAVMTDAIPKTINTVALVNLTNFIIMCLITYWWFNYVLAVIQAPHRNRTINQFAVVFPLLVSFIATVFIFLTDPHKFVNSNLDVTGLYAAFQITIPDIYIVAVLIYTVRTALAEDNISQRRIYLALGIFPLVVIILGLIQITLLPQSSLFCFGSTILMLIFYIEAMEGRISLDPLTKLNNRGQLRRYVAQESNMHREGLDTYIVMIDINDFKSINDSFGHAEGDHALVVTADAFKKAVGSMELNAFIGRYGGDEFTIVVHTNKSEDLDDLARRIRAQLVESCKAEHLPYIVSIGIGWAKLSREGDTVSRCIERADRNLYINKEEIKRGAA